MKKLIFLIIMSMVLVSFPCYAQAPNVQNFKVVAYYSEVFNEPVENLQYDKLTHIIYAFAIPQSDGTILPVEKPEKLKALVDAAHKKNVKVCIAIGGWSYKNVPLAPNFEALASTPETRCNFTNNVIKMLDTYQLDGVDLDWEYPIPTLSDANYEALILDMSKALKPLNKTLSAALSGAWSPTEGPFVNTCVSTKCLKAFDWINVMSYDTNDTNHAPYSHTETSIQYWVKRGMPAEKIAIGMPLYARPSWKQYRQLIAENREYALKDFAPTSPLESWYNGLPTVKEKTRLALLTAGGVMLFDINEDTSDETSILSAIHSVVQTAKADQPTFEKAVNCTIEGQELGFSPSDDLGTPFIDSNGRTLMPVRKSLENIGITINYDPVKREVLATKDTQQLLIPIDTNVIYINSTPVTMDTKAIIKNNRVYIPLRYVFESFNYKVDWHSGSKTAIVIKK